MTELVTNYAASSQLNLLAPRQQGFGASGAQQPAPQAPAAPTADSNTLESVQRASDKADSQSFSSQLSQRDTESGASSGPSRPRVEIKQFKVGQSAAEVVGTPDVLQRFDRNGDGRVDMMESQKAVMVRQEVSTFSGLAAAPGINTAAPDATRAPVSTSTLTEEQAPVLARETGEALAALGKFSDVGLPKKFVQAAEGEPGLQKFHDAVPAVTGAPTGEVDAPKRFYGEGTEVVAGQGRAAPQPEKYFDRAAAREQAVREDGTGETKYYDRVAQAEGGDTNGDATGNGESYAEKAQQIAAAVHGKQAAQEVKAYGQAETVEVPAAMVTA